MFGSHQTLLVCPPKLSNFDTAQAEFKNYHGRRVLFIDEKAKLEYTFEDKNLNIHLEGTVTPEFYKARTQLYKTSICI